METVSVLPSDAIVEEPDDHSTHVVRRVHGAQYMHVSADEPELAESSVDAVISPAPAVEPAVIVELAPAERRSVIATLLRDRVALCVVAIYCCFAFATTGIVRPCAACAV